MTRRRGSDFFIKLTVIFFLIVTMCTIAGMQLRYNELRETRDALLAEIEARNGRLEKLTDELEMPFNDEYVTRIARRKLNLCRPEEILFYNDLLK